MWRILRWIFTGDGHIHQWKEVRVYNMKIPNTERVVAKRYEEVCTICNTRRTNDIDLS